MSGMCCDSGKIPNKCTWPKQFICIPYFFCSKSTDCRILLQQCSYTTRVPVCFPSANNIYFSKEFTSHICVHAVTLVLCWKLAVPLATCYHVDQQRVKNFCSCSDVTHTDCPLNTANSVRSTILPAPTAHNSVLIGLFWRYSTQLWSFSKLHEIVPYCRPFVWSIGRLVGRSVGILLYSTFYNMYKEH
jgi:hypothetical protein